MMKNKITQNKLAQKQKHKLPKAKHGQRVIVELKPITKSQSNVKNPEGKPYHQVK